MTLQSGYYDPRDPVIHQYNHDTRPSDMINANYDPRDDVHRVTVDYRDPILQDPDYDPRIPDGWIFES